MVSKPNNHGISRTIETTDNTQTTLLSWQVPSNTGFLLSVSILAVKTNISGTAKRYGWQNIVSGHYTGAALAFASGTPNIVDTGPSDFNITIAGSSGEIRVRVTGVTSENVRWVGTMSILNTEAIIA